MMERFKSMSQLQKQLLIISICAVLIAALALIYLFVLKPFIDNMGGGDEEVIELLDGESLGTTNRIMITPRVDKSEMKNVQVKNEIDNFKVIHHLGNNTYYVDGASTVPINQEVIASFFTNVGYLLSMLRVAAKDIDDGNEILENLEDFGLNPEDPGKYFIVTRTDDSWYKIIIGDKIPTTGGYYAMYEDKDGLRPAIYILDTMMEETILSTRYSVMLPIISDTIKQNEIMFLDNFRFYKNRELIVEIYNGPIIEERGKLVNYQMRYPAPYLVSSDKYGTLTSAFLYFVGDRVVYAFSEDDVIALITDEGELSYEAAEKFMEFGFNENTTRISFELNDREFYYLFSKPNENGDYYVLSTDFYSIVEISRDKLILMGEIQPFVEWDLLKFVDKPILDQNINDVESIIIKVPGKADAVFTLEGEGQELKVKGNGVDLIVNKIDEEDYFRGFYYSLLSIDLLDYETDVYENDDLLMLEMIITMRDEYEKDYGIKELAYKFYFVEGNTRRSFFSINGVGDFYVLRDKVIKLRNDTELVLQNLPIAKEAAE